MAKALDQLAELVRQAEGKDSSEEVESETQQVTDHFESPSSEPGEAIERHRVVRPAKLRVLEQADTDEQVLKDLIRKLALYKSSLGSQADAEKLIAASQAEIEQTRRESQAELEGISRELEEARRELRVAIDSYRQLPSRTRPPSAQARSSVRSPRIGCSGTPKPISREASSSFWLTKSMPA